MVLPPAGVEWEFKMFGMSRSLCIFGVEFRKYIKYGIHKQNNGRYSFGGFTIL